MRHLRRRKLLAASAAIAVASAGLWMTFQPNPCFAAQIAASIEYDFRAGEGASLRFLAVKTIDGMAMDAALWLPNDKQPTDTTLVVMVHGSGGSYRRAPESALGPRLASQGFAALAINTRQHDGFVNTDNFLDI